jgi:hypothetical protein
VCSSRCIACGSAWPACSASHQQSLLSDNGLRIDEIARLVGHSSSAVTELVYRQQIRPVVQRGAVIMDRIFDVNEDS